MKRTWRWIREHITGISVPIFGIQWQASPSEQNAIRTLLVFLEDRRVLHIDEMGLEHVRAAHLRRSEWVT